MQAYITLRLYGSCYMLVKQRIYAIAGKLPIIVINNLNYSIRLEDYITKYWQLLRSIPTKKLRLRGFVLHGMARQE